MNDQERSLFDEIWEAAGLTDEPKPEEATAAEEPKAEEPATEEPTAEEPVAEEPAAEQPVAEEPIIEEPIVKEPKNKEKKKKKEKPLKKVKKEKKEPKETPQAVSDHAEKKKSVKFLVIYTVVFVIVISALISGSFMISQRIHLENDEALSGSEHHQSTLQNIKDKNEALKKENASLKEQNENLTVSEQDSTELLDSAADMVEHGEYLSAAMAEYIDGSRADARAILATVDREKLSPTGKEYYDLLDKKLN